MIPGVKINPYKLWPDDRGYFLEVLRVVRAWRRVPVQGMFQVKLVDLRKQSASFGARNTLYLGALKQAFWFTEPTVSTTRRTKGTSLTTIPRSNAIGKRNTNSHGSRIRDSLPSTHGYHEIINIRSRLTSWAKRHWFSCSLIIPVILLAAVLLIRWEATLNYLGDYLVSSHSPQSADLILVLAGDFWGARVLKGADLALQGYAPLALMSGTPYQGSMDGELAIKFLAKQGYPTRLFQSFGHNARSTIEEAIVLRPELARRGVKRVLLVTSAYHSRRAAIVFRLFCPGIRFIAIPAPEIQYHPEGWWKDSNSRRLFFSEWKKILATILIVYPKYRAENIIGR